MVEPSSARSCAYNPGVSKLWAGCRNCGGDHAEQLLVSKAMARVDYYRCLQCGHVWTIPEEFALREGARGVRGRSATLQHALVLLARDTCACLPDMVKSLERALAVLGWAGDYACVNIGSLDDADVRKGYPSPTLLWHGRDLFGMPVPTPPFAAPG